MYSRIRGTLRFPVGNGGFEFRELAHFPLASSEMRWSLESGRSQQGRSACVRLG